MKYKKFLYPLLFVGILINVFFATYYVRHGDLYFFTDVARDFLLFQEVDLKKIILIGPRSSTTGIFHGPLWIYLTYPAYLLGRGDPIVVGWFWIALTIVFLLSGFFVARKLFGNLAALIYVLLLSGNMMFQTRALFNPHGALFLMPVFFLTIFYYWRKRRAIYLALHLFLGALMIQFQMAIGIPLVMLSAPIIFYLIFQTKQWRHLILFLVLFISLANFVIFEVRHDFNMVRSILAYASPTTPWGTPYNYLPQVDNRIEHLANLQLVWGAPGYLMGFLFALSLLLTYWKLKEDRQNRDIYLLFMYYFFGYVFLTFVNKGVVLEHQFFPMFALTNLWFASLATLRSKKLFFFLLALVVIYTYKNMNGFLSQARDFIGTDQNSWKALHEMGQYVAATAPQKFGYFVYAPDAFAYQPRAAMIYTFKFLGKEAYEYVKLPVTYVIAAPAPPDRPYIGYLWWRTDQANIKATPSATLKFPSGFVVERFDLTPEEQKVPFEPTINVGIHFR